MSVLPQEAAKAELPSQDLRSKRVPLKGSIRRFIRGLGVEGLGGLGLGSSLKGSIRFRV